MGSNESNAVSYYRGSLDNGIILLALTSLLKTLSRVNSGIYPQSKVSFDCNIRHHK